MDTSEKQLSAKHKSSDEIKRSNKRDASLNYNPTLYFLIGLAITLLSTYSLFEMNFKVKNLTSTTYSPPMDDSYLYNDVTYVVQNQLAVIKNQDRPAYLNPIISNEPKFIEKKVFENEPNDSETPAVPINTISVVEPIEEPEIPIILVEHVPEYPGCDKGSNTDKRKCMSGKISKFVINKFNNELASELGLIGRQRISVVFKIDKNGNVTNVRSRAPHPALEKEAARVIKLLPKMKPGRQRGKAVVVPYSLQIVFDVQD